MALPQEIEKARSLFFSKAVKARKDYQSILKDFNLTDQDLFDKYKKGKVKADKYIADLHKLAKVHDIQIEAPVQPSSRQAQSTQPEQQKRIIAHDPVLDQEVSNPENAVKAVRMALRQESRLPVEISRSWVEMEDELASNPAVLYRELVDMIIANKDLVPTAYNSLLAWRKNYKGEDPTTSSNQETKPITHGEAPKDLGDFLSKRGLEATKMPQSQQKYVATYINTLEKLTGKQIKFA